MVGTLATILRMGGYAPSTPSTDAETDAILEIAGGEGRTIVTRDRQLAEQARAAEGLDAIVLTTREWPDQAAELDAAGVAFTRRADALFGL